MKILMLTASLPYPPHQGGALRSYGILHGLKHAGHEITLLSFDDGTNGDPSTTPLGQYCERIVTLPTPVRSRADRLRDLLLSDQADIARRLYSDEFLNCLKGLLVENDFDLVQFEGIEIAPYLPLVRQVRHSGRLCYDAFNAEADLQRLIFEVDRREPARWPPAVYSFIQSRRIARFERDLCQQADLVIAVSEEDAVILRQYQSDREVLVVPNGIFADEYADPVEQLDLGAHALVFTGKMDYRPNVDAMQWFTGSILPRIHQHVPDAKLYIVGQKPHQRLEQLRENQQIEVTGWVPSVRPFLQGAGVYVAPLRMGSGTRLKILEAMASGCAVVATPIAASGMLPETRQAMVIADQPDAIADAITRLLNDPAERQTMGEAARACARQFYDWSVLIPRLVDGYRKIGLE